MRGTQRADISPADTVGPATACESPNLDLNLGSLSLKVAQMPLLAPLLESLFRTWPLMKGQVPCVSDVLGSSKYGP
eukprot:4125132-Alexandrium_andersonii.AAC.1